MIPITGRGTFDMSVFSGGENWRIEYTSPNARPVTLSFEPNEKRLKRFLGLIKVCRYLTVSQISNTVYFEGNIENLKKILHKMSVENYLLEHKVYNGSTFIYNVYSMGPRGYKFINQLDNGYYRQQHSIITMMKILSMNQLFMNMTSHSWVTIMADLNQYPYPTTLGYIRKKYGALKDNLDKNVSFVAISVRKHGENMSLIKQFLKDNVDQNIYVITHDKKTMDRLLPFMGEKHIISYDDKLIKEKHEVQE